VIGAYPGTFDPPTIAHLAIAEAALRQCRLDRLDLVVNAMPIEKAGAQPVDERIALLDAIAANRPWLGVARTEHRLIADIAAGYDVLVLGADKWAQVVDPEYYASAAERDAAVARLPRLAVAPRGGLPLPDGCIVLDVDLPNVSSTAARSGRHELVAPEVKEAVLSRLDDRHRPPAPR
jgi:nicotinate-nucleotide adenylyltransferase